MIKLKSGKDERGKMEFYLLGLEGYDDFDQVIKELCELHLTIVDDLNGIYSRVATLADGLGNKFKIIFHEDVGIYAYSLNKNNGTRWLRRILEKLVDIINERDA